MSAYYLHDGQNEVGPLTIDILKKQKLSRTTPIRQKDSDTWMPAEKLDALKELVAPKKIRRPRDILPVVGEQIAYLKQKKPRVLYGSLFGLAVLACLSIYSVSKTIPPKAAEPVAPIKLAESVAVAVPAALQETSPNNKRRQGKSCTPAMDKIDFCNQQQLWNRAAWRNQRFECGADQSY
jgi:hypothetical protein